MRQIVLEQPGRFASVDAAPPKPRAGEALVRVHRVGVCGTDLHAFAGRQPYFTYPRVLGHELGVEVVEAPANGRGVRPGDRCAVEPYLSCGECHACRAGKYNCCERLEVLGVHTGGGMRELIAVPGVRQTVLMEPFKPPHGVQPLGGVAVIADNTWTAFQGRKKLGMVWDHGPNAAYNSDQFKKELQETARRPGKVVRNEGDVDAEFRSEERR